MTLTPSMIAALSYAATNNQGLVFAGQDVRKGCRITTSGKSMLALETRGLLVVSLSTEGGLVGRITDAGRDVFESLSKSNV
jgi:hypothetical protein